MTVDIRSRLVARMREALETRTANLPDSIPFTMDLGPLADAVIAEMTNGGGVPIIPTYDHDVWEKRHWTVPFISEEVINGASVYDIAVKCDPGSSDKVIRPTVVFTTRASGVGEIAVALSPEDAEEFLISGMAAVTAARDAAN